MPHTVSACEASDSPIVPMPQYRSQTVSRPVRPAASAASSYSRSAIAVFVCRKAFGRTRKRRPQSPSSIAFSPQRSSVGRFVTSAGESFTDQWIDFTSGKRRSVSIR